MGKLIFWVVVILGALMAARLIARYNARKDTDQEPLKNSKKQAASSLQDGQESMVRCAHCGIHLPRSEALLQNGETWCSADHARLGHTRN